MERLLVVNQTRESIASGEHAVVILDRTPFYAESGGQVGDTGELRLGNAEFVVEDTIKLAGVYHGHVGMLSSGSLKLGDRVIGEVDGERRGAIVLNHSATHLLHAALRQVLGEHVQQKGSMVAPDRLRFDFSHFQPVSDAELKQVETHRQQRSAPQRRGRGAPDGHAGSDRVRRHGLVRREVRRTRARAEDGRVLDRTVRRNACVAHRRHRPDQDHLAKAASLPACAASRR